MVSQQPLGVKQGANGGCYPRMHKLAECMSMFRVCPNVCLSVCPKCNKGDYAKKKNSQMPCHLISDAYEWINEIPTVPIYYLAKPQPRERAWNRQRGKKTLLSLTLI